MVREASAIQPACLTTLVIKPFARPALRGRYAGGQPPANKTGATGCAATAPRPTLSMARYLRAENTKRRGRVVYDNKSTLVVMRQLFEEVCS